MEFRGEFETETRAIEDRKREFRVVELTDATIRMEFTAFEASPFTAKYEGKGSDSESETSSLWASPLRL